MYVSGNERWTFPKVWRGQIVRVLHHKAVGAICSAQNLIMMMRMEEKLTPIKIKTWASRTANACLYESVG